jgi:hypothetical protein
MDNPDDNEFYGTKKNPDGTTYLKDGTETFKEAEKLRIEKLKPLFEKMERQKHFIDKPFKRWSAEDLYEMSRRND